MNALEGARLNRARCQALLGRRGVGWINVNTWLGFLRRFVHLLDHLEYFAIARIVSFIVLLEIHPRTQIIYLRQSI